MAHLSVRLLSVCVLFFLPSLTTANAQYVSRASAPPLTLSPDLTSPWTLQVSPDSKQQLKQRQKRETAPFSRRYKIPSQYLPTTVAYNGGQKPGTIIIDTETRYLYLVERGGKARRYGVGVGRPGFEWAGTHRVTSKKEWPDWRPPAEMIKRQPNLPSFMPGGPQNPLGARALYLGSTLYRIHGSNEPWTIGQAVSSGCIRMRNEDVIELYQMVG
ncbi:L,D-transpeptidase, partial [Rhodobacteraceae bacterium RKSG542]|uniref:L,D-transpeptidase n=1 Tax=Pseudovibrio flavus TaxID=2529854 RepID=UPI0012BD8063